MLKNKSGAIEIVLLVLLVLLVIFVALFNFVVGSKSIQANIYDSRFIEGVYQKQDLAEFYIRQVGEEVISENGKNGFKENFKIEFVKYDFAPQAYPETFLDKMPGGTEDYLNDLHKIISEDKFNVFVNEDILEVVINEFEIKDSFEKVEVSYYPKISLKFNLED